MKKPKVTRDTFPVPAAAMTAYALLLERFQKDANALGMQAVQALGRDPAETGVDYNVDFSTGRITRTERQK